MEIQNIKPDCEYNFEGCDKVALGVFRAKWTCGRCLLKFEAAIKQQNSKVLDIIENKLKENNDNR